MKNRSIAGLALATTMALSIGPTPSLAKGKSCWGQASAVFARMGEMGLHASLQPTPRAGLRNLAVLLWDAGILDEPTMQALGAFVAAAEGLSIDACM